MTQFLKSLFQEMTYMFQIDHRKTTPYHPQTNDQMERVNGTLERILCNTVLDSKKIGMSS